MLFICLYCMFVLRFVGNMFLSNHNNKFISVACKKKNSSWWHARGTSCNFTQMWHDMSEFFITNTCYWVIIITIENVVSNISYCKKMKDLFFSLLTHDTSAIDKQRHRIKFVLWMASEQNNSLNWLDKLVFLLMILFDSKPQTKSNLNL